MAEETSGSPTRRSSDTAEIHNSGHQDSPSQSSSSNLGNSDTIRRRPAPVQTLQEGYGTLSRQPTSSADQPSLKSAKKPAMSRRTTSTQFPHKGQEFSVDDAQDEVGLELERQLERQRKLERQAKGVATGSLRSQSQSTIRRRPAAQAPTLSKVPSSGDEEVVLPALRRPEGPQTSTGEDATVEPDDEGNLSDDDDGDDEDGDVSDAESFTLKDRQDAINVTHPFGIRIWKPALYKKDRSVQKTAEEEIHSSPGGHVSTWLLIFNYLWTVLFGWWLALICFAGAIFCLVLGLFSENALGYAGVLLGLSRFLFYPFGKFVRLLQDEAYAAEDEGEGRSISEYEQWQSGDLEEGRLFFGPSYINRSLIGRRRTSVESVDETQSLLGRTRRGIQARQSLGGAKTRFFGRGKWNWGRVVFFIFFHSLITPTLLTVCGICWFMVFTIPMGKVTWLVWDHLRRHPLAMSFHTESTDIRYPGEPPSSILLCTYRAVGPKYWKFTIDGTNILLFNLLGLVAFTIVDYWVLRVALDMHTILTSQGLIFGLALASIIPLAYFIGQAVASISAQSSMGVGATVNAFFSTIVEVYLYCIALAEGKAQLVEGSIIGSIFAGILFLPGLSMCFGALKRKTQRFNVRSAGVTSTMMLFAMIGAFGPTLFYQIYGSHELKCYQCTSAEQTGDRDCRRCFFSQIPAVNDRFYQEAVLPYIWLSAGALFLSYVIGLLFTLRTHAAVIWSSDHDEKRGPELSSSQLISNPDPIGSPELMRQSTTGSLVIAPPRSDIRDSQLYQRILGQSLKQTVQTPPDANNRSRPESQSQQHSLKSPHIVPPKGKDGEVPGLHLQSLSEADNQTLTLHVAEMAATAAAVAARDATKAPRKTSQSQPSRAGPDRPQTQRSLTTVTAAEAIDVALHPEASQVAGGHDAPNWSRTKSAIILLTATLAYAVIAEILVNTVDAVLENVDIDEKFLGITLFALVPNTTEFLNAISFAMNGNIALSMEIGSAYALQVCLLQIPALVLYSAVHGRFINAKDVIDHTFTLIFPQWDMVTVILCIFLLSYMYGEGKSNYFKGSILILAYIVVISGFWFASYDTNGRIRGVHDENTLAVGSLSALRGLVSGGAELEFR